MRINIYQIDGEKDILIDRVRIRFDGDEAFAQVHRHRSDAVPEEDCGEEVLGAMGLHICIPMVPIQRQERLRSDRWLVAIDDMQWLPIVILDRIDDAEISEESPISRLSASLRIEHRTIKLDATIADGDHRRFGLAEVSVAVIELI